MTGERWQRIKDIFHAALELPAADRAVFLSSRCAGDPDLLREIESLMTSDERAGNFLEAGAMQDAAALLTDDPVESMEDRRIGPYRLLREIGRGGMGVVYLAERDDDQYRKTVAIKLLKRGMDTDFILRRFRHERQILADLDHPNIARLLDGGTTEDGLPYFVMEFIEGKPLDEYCDAHQLSVERRIELFRGVCSAVTYAHQRSIVHRDLKPTNILVTPDGTPNLLDFGIAKLLTGEPSDTADLTGTSITIMTPDYASPEQVRKEPITADSDIYSLGVVLYELLTGHRPYRLKNRSAVEIAKVVCEEEPTRPSEIITRRDEVTGTGGARMSITPESVGNARAEEPARLRRRLRGDVDHIVLKALRKEPAQRYASVDQFSEDLHRYLMGLPVRARKGTFRYLAVKFVRRNKMAAIAAALIGISLIGGIVATAWQARVARAERARAERRFNDVRKLANSFVFEIHDAIRDLPGATKARELLVKRALEYLDSLAREASGDEALQRELAAAYLRIGNVNRNLGDKQKTLASYGKALQIAETLQIRHPGRGEYRDQLADILSRIGGTHHQRGEFDRAAEYDRRVVSLLENVRPLGPDPTTTLGYSYLRMGDALAVQGNLEGALTLSYRARDLSQQWLHRDPGNRSAKFMLANSHFAIAEILGDPGTINLGEPEKALAMLRGQSTLFREELASDPTNTAYQYQTAYNLKQIGVMLGATGDWNEADRISRESIAMWDALSRSDPVNVYPRVNLADAFNDLAEGLTRRGRLREALSYHSAAEKTFSGLPAAETDTPISRFILSRSHRLRGDTLLAAGEPVKALESYKRGLDVNEAGLRAAPKDLRGLLNLARDYSAVGGAEVVLATRAPRSERVALWQQALRRLQHSRDLYLQLRNRNIKTEPLSAELTSVMRQIARCEAALDHSGRPQNR